uniref:MARVEL domain-containing protein n=1 Tax=Rhabditophanes sp. KR3021 TaxID=114890 RepID=A0AC35U6W3_9BILA
MSTPPASYRTSGNSQQNKFLPSFPPPLYYRDTYGLTPIYEQQYSDSMVTDNSDDTITTRSTIKTTVNLSHNAHMMHESQTSRGTAMTQSFHIEQITTNRILITNIRTLFTLSLIAFVAAIQLLMFSIICLFYDGSPLYLALIISIVFIINAAILIYFIKQNPCRFLLYLCIATTALCIILSLVLFFWTAYLVYDEDRELRNDGWNFAQANLLNSNRIVSNTRIAMYSLHMLLTPVEGIACVAILYVLYRNMKKLRDGHISRGYFISEPVGHQTVLVPIELKQVRRIEAYDDDAENASIGVQTGV